ncbi:MAG: response regulator [Bacteroidota bacterium]
MDQTPGQAPMVLIVEDNPEIRALLSEHLSRTYEVYLAEDGIQGIQMAKKLLPDLIITDLMMPGKNGYELCQAIKQDQLTSHIFIIMLTVKSSEESVKKGLQKGADYYLTKPFNLELLELNVQNILRYRQNMAKSLMNEDTEQATIETQTAEELQISEIDLAFLKKLNDTIEKNLANSDFSVVDLTQELQFSKSQLYRKLKAMVGMSANTYIRTKRLQRALELLKTDQYTVAEVTYKVGFNDLQYFRSCFKNQYGVNPSEYLSRPSSEP